MSMSEVESQEFQERRGRVLEGEHRLLLEALRHREQEIIRYLAILGPALGGFVWLLTADAVKDDNKVFIIGTIGVQLLLFLGMHYSAALGYSHRHITLQLAKLEAILGVKDCILKAWPRSPKDFIARYQKTDGGPWCEPPEVIRSFWLAFIAGELGVTLAAFVFRPSCFVFVFLGALGLFFAWKGYQFPAHYGKKLREQCEKETDQWVSDSGRAIKPTKEHSK